MKKSSVRLSAQIALVATAGVFATAADLAAPAAYPIKPIRLVVPFAPAGTTDILARIVASRVTDAFGKQVVIDNRAGAGGVVGADLVAKAAPDGYTLLMGASSINAVNPAVYKKLPYNHLTDFAGVSLLGMVPNVLIVNPSLPVSSVADLTAYAKKNPRKLTFASPGTGTPMHLAGEWFKERQSLDIAHVPYKGAAPALTELVGGQVSMMFNTIPAVLPYINSSRLKALAVTSPERTSVLPNTPTMVESGLKGFEVTSWFAIFAPARVPKEIVHKLNAVIVSSIRDPAIGSKLAQVGVDPRADTPASLDHLVQSETKKWAAVVRTIGLTLE